MFYDRQGVKGEEIEEKLIAEGNVQFEKDYIMDEPNVIDHWKPLVKHNGMADLHISRVLYVLYCLSSKSNIKK